MNGKWKIGTIGTAYGWVVKKFNQVDKLINEKEKDWKNKIKQISNRIPEDLLESLIIVGKGKTKFKGKKEEIYLSAIKLIKARIANLESNLHIEIDMERIEDKSKALSYIGIEVAEALKGIPTPIEKYEPTPEPEENKKYIEETRFEVKPSLWQRIKTSKLVRALAYITKIRIVIDVPALPEGQNKQK